jgi:uncharacterized protein
MQKLLKIFILFFFFVFLTTSNAYQMLELKKSTYDIAKCNKESYTPDNLKSYKALIDQGELQGYNCVGIYYVREKDYDKAKEYFQKGADKGSIESYTQLGSLYSHWLKQPKKSFKYYEIAANAGDIKATHNLGVEYDRQLNYKQALKWYQKAADMGNTYSLLAVATVYLKQNKTQKAIETFEKVGELGDSLGYFNLGVIYDKNKQLQDENRSSQYFLKCYEMGNGECAGALGQTYESKKDYPKAIEWYKKGFALGSKDSVTRLGYLYKNVLKDKEKGLYWYKQGYEKVQCGDCAFSIALTYQNLKEYNQAIEWFLKAYEVGQQDAAYGLGYLYETDLKDKEKAIEWYKKSLKTNSTYNAKYHLKKLGAEDEQ